MKPIQVELGQLVINSNPDSVLQSAPLGMQLAVAAYDIQTHIGGMLVTTVFSEIKNLQKPTLFVETGLPLLLQRLHELTCQKPNLKFWIIGGGEMPALFPKIAEPFVEKIQTVLKTQAFQEASVHVGGPHSIIVTLFLKEGKLTLLENGGRESAL